MAYMDILRLGEIFTAKGLHFWGTIFTYISEAAQIWEEKTDNFAMLPIFGGLIQKHAHKQGIAKWLSIFDSNGKNKTIFRKY
jgi:hypothetical protein